MNSLNSFIVSLSKAAPFRDDLDYHLIRAVMVFTFYIFSYQKWFSFEVHQITPFINHSPLVFWLIPAFGVRGASFFLGRDGIVVRHADPVGLLGSKAWRPRGAWLDRHFSWHRHHLPFFPNAWAAEAGGLPAMDLPVAFLMNDFLFLAASFYLLKQALMRAALERPLVRRSKTDSDYLQGSL